MVKVKESCLLCVVSRVLSTTSRWRLTSVIDCSRFRPDQITADKKDEGGESSKVRQEERKDRS